MAKKKAKKKTKSVPSPACEDGPNCDGFTLQQKQRAIVRCIIGGGTALEACRVADCDLSTYYTWIARNIKFAKAVLAAQSVRVAVIEDAVFAAAKERDSRDHLDIKSAQAYLAAHSPALWDKRGGGKKSTKGAPGSPGEGTLKDVLGELAETRKKLKAKRLK